MDLNEEILLRIVEWRRQLKPRPWIAREEGLSLTDVNAVLRVAGDSRPDKISLEKYDLLETLVNDNWSLTEIRRTHGIDPRTVKRWFPHAGIMPGSDEHRRRISLGRRMAEIERKEVF